MLFIHSYHSSTALLVTSWYTIKIQLPYMGKFGRGKIWRITSYSPKFSLPIFTDTPKMYLAQLCVDCSLFTKFFLTNVFTGSYSLPANIFLCTMYSIQLNTSQLISSYIASYWYGLCVLLLFQDGTTPFRCAVEQERSKIVKYFVEEVKVDITLYDQVMIVAILYIYFSLLVSLI